MKCTIIQGSARSDGNTAQVADVIAKSIGSAEVVHLCEQIIHPYTYEHTHIDDDFLPLMKELVSHDTLILVTPVYWYSMSGLMKTFLDRITDCLQIEKETGRKLRGKHMAVVSCGSEDMRIEGYFVPFRLSADYLGMKYIGDAHTWISDGHIEEPVGSIIKNITNQIKKK